MSFSLVKIFGLDFPCVFGNKKNTPWDKIQVTFASITYLSPGIKKTLTEFEKKLDQYP